MSFTQKTNLRKLALRIVSIFTIISMVGCSTAPLTIPSYPQTDNSRNAENFRVLKETIIQQTRLDLDSKLRVALEAKHCNPEDLTQLGKTIKEFVKTLQPNQYDLQFTCKIVNISGGWKRLIKEYEFISHKSEEVIYRIRYSDEINPQGKIVDFSPTKKIKIKKPDIINDGDVIPVVFLPKKGIKKGEAIEIYLLSKDKTEKVLVFAVQSGFEKTIKEVKTRFRLFRESDFIVKHIRNGKAIAEAPFSLQVIKERNYASTRLVKGEGNGGTTHRIKASKKRRFLKSLFINDMMTETHIQSIKYQSWEGYIYAILSILVARNPYIGFKFKDHLAYEDFKVNVTLVK
jgi:hypothetical protein